MLKGIIDYINTKTFPGITLVGTDIKTRINTVEIENINGEIHTFYGKEYDFLGDNYPYYSADYII